MRKKTYRISLLFGICCCLILNIKITFAQCGADGLQPCGKTSVASKVAPKRTVTKPSASAKPAPKAQPTRKPAAAVRKNKRITNRNRQTAEEEAAGQTPQNVNVGIMNSRATNLPKPVYPQSARQANASGEVRVQVTVDEDGYVVYAKAISGHQLLRSAAETAALQSRFNPVKVGDQPVQANGIVVYNFINDTPDDSAKCSCPSISVSGPSGTTAVGGLMTFSANVSGGSASNITYNWSVSNGTIVSGQGTPGISVSTAGLNNTSITATVEIGGTDPACNCNKAASGTGTVEGINYTKEAEKYFNYAHDSCGKNDYDCQISNYTKAIELNPNYAVAYNNRGVSYQNKDNYDEAIRDFNRAIGLNPNYPVAYFNLGFSYNGKRNYDEAIRNFSKAIELNPNYADAYIYRGDSYLDKGSRDEAIRNYTKAIELNPNNALAYLRRGVSNRIAGFDDAAISDMTKYLELNPNSKGDLPFYNRASAYLNKKMYDLAIADITKAIEFNPKFANHYLLRGRAFYLKADYTSAFADYTKAIEISPSASAYNGLGNIYYSQGDYNAAIQNYTRSIALEPNSAAVYKNRAGAYRGLKQTSLAEADERKAQELSGGKP